MNKLINFIASKTINYRSWIIGLIIFLMAISISFYANSESTYWLWADYPFFAVILFLIASFFSAVLLRIQTILHEKELEKIKKISENPIDLLSFREQEVVKLILQQKNNQEIADDLHVEISTIKTHINHIYKELAVKNRKELVQLLS